MKKIVYIAGALNSDAVGYIKNMHNTISYGIKVKKEGFAVFVPGLDFLMGLMDGGFDYADYFDNSQPIMLKCDYVFVCPGWENSKGTKKEIELATVCNIPVVYNDIEQLKGLAGLAECS